MNKMMTDKTGEDHERRAIAAWARKHRVTPEAADELLKILYGTPTLIKGDTHDR